MGSEYLFNALCPCNSKRVPVDFESSLCLGSHPGSGESRLGCSLPWLPGPAWVKEKEDCITNPAASLCNFPLNQGSRVQNMLLKDKTHVT